MTTIFRLCHHQIFNCLVGVWVIEQHAIILSATVCSPTVKQQTKQAEELKCWYGRMLYSAINQHCTCRWPGTKQKQHWYQLLYAQILLIPNDQQRQWWYQKPILCPQIHLLMPNDQPRRRWYQKPVVCPQMCLFVTNHQQMQFWFQHDDVCGQIIGRCNVDINTCCMPTDAPHGTRSSADAMLI